jgi:hypothetical protein
MPLAQQPGETFLELRHLGAGGKNVAFQNLSEAMKLGLAKVMAEIGVFQFPETPRSRLTIPRKTKGAV